MLLITLGHYSLAISSMVYIVWLWPQLWHNRCQQHMRQLSFALHVLLFSGYITDLVYGFGLHMQWPYRLVTLSGLLVLVIQHVQFSRVKIQDNRLLYYCASLGLCVLLLVALFVLNIMPQQTQHFYNIAGTLSMLCFTGYMLPQIIYNYRAKVADGLSVLVICLSVFLGGCDLISACAFSWDWPSVVGPVIGLLLKFILLSQYFLFKRRV